MSLPCLLLCKLTHCFQTPAGSNLLVTYFSLGTHSCIFSSLCYQNQFLKRVRTSEDINTKRGTHINVTMLTENSMLKVVYELKYTETRTYLKTIFLNYTIFIRNCTSILYNLMQYQTRLNSQHNITIANLVEQNIFTISTTFQITG